MSIYTINLGQNVYGGKLNLTTGVLEATRAIAVFDGSDDENWQYSERAGGFYLDNALDVATTFETSKTVPQCLCNKYKEERIIPLSSQLQNRDDYSYCNQTENYYKRLWVKDSRYSNETDFKAALASNNLQLVYPLADPYVAVLTKEEIKTFLGGNTFYADTGDVEVVYYANANL